MLGGGGGQVMLKLPGLGARISGPLLQPSPPTALQGEQRVSEKVFSAVREPAGSRQRAAALAAGPVLPKRLKAWGTNPFSSSPYRY